MKVSVVGGGGLVGSMAAYALHLGRVASDIAIVDANEQVAQGVALDILQGTSLVADQRVVSGPIQEQIPDSDVVVVTAGLRRKPEESRLDLINRNTDLFLDLLAKLRQAGWKPGATLVVVSNPVDILTHLAVERSGLDWRHVIGLGTQLDTARLNSHLARRLKVPATQVRALLLGEHGDSMVPIWSSATVAGMPLAQWPGYNAQMEKEVFEETKTAGATMIKLKGGSGFAVGVSIREVVESILLDSRKVLPVSTLQQGLYGLHDICLSVPTVLGAGGAMAQVEVSLAPREQVALHNSARVLKETLDMVRTRLASGRSSAPSATPAAPVTRPAEGQRVIPRSTWQPSR
ncbi:MAG: lactate dehydrogenase [Planctomycetota bacterium]|nr:MAG: lactate dehydrogenase [Planctomycetota bacterium]